MLNRLEDKPTWLVNQLYLRAHRLLADSFAQAGSRGYHYRLLVALDQLGSASQAELGRLSGIDRSDIVAALNELAADGYVKRETDSADRRRNVVSLTRLGIKRLDELEPVVTEVQQSLLAPLTRAERSQFVALLRKLIDA